MKAIQGYVHHDKSFGVMVEFEVGTDFTIRTPDFKAFAERVAMAFGLNDIRENAPKVEGPHIDLCVWRTLYTTMADGDETIAETLAAASKKFHEPIRVTRIWDTRDEETTVVTGGKGGDVVIGEGAVITGGVVIQGGQGGSKRR